MFGIFKKTSEVEKLQKKYEKLMADWHRLSTTNRSESDKKYSEAQEILDRIESLKNE
ncbi:Lacal_2735 family protein [Winogradskyella alexanderae]|uniref:Lacal_2735 family protein n=1 Tax=Winogradskyella alexanderae TaxID=2877123 RepID=A0ABS7XS76_9FLAO|nr:Lacal_2735 family protein [Winogradskyella alexanderae]MCA0131886.1 Lacal_2735 family protein [Winogradskyella alexanderae]